VSTPDDWGAHSDVGAATEARVVKDEPDRWDHLMYARITGPSGSYDEYIRTTPDELLEKVTDLGDLRDIRAAESVVEKAEYTAVSTIFSAGGQAVLVRSFLRPRPRTDSVKTE